MFAFLSWFFLQTCSHSLNEVKSLDCFVWFFLYYLPHLFSSDCFPGLTFLWSCKCFIWIYEFFKHHPLRVFCNVNLSNLENVLQRNLMTEHGRECIFRASGGTNFRKFITRSQPWWRLYEFEVCTGLPKKLLIHHWMVQDLTQEKYLTWKEILKPNG